MFSMQYRFLIKLDSVVGASLERRARLLGFQSARREPFSSRGPRFAP
jgi:hypothetical protein